MKDAVLAVGEVLWDLLPAGKQLGGAPANFTYHCRSLGAGARLVSRVGADDLGRELLERSRLLSLPTELIQVDPAAPTGTVDVSLGTDGQPRYTIREGVAWDWIEADAPALAAASRADAVCFGSLAQRGEASRRAIRVIVVAARPDALRVLDVNLRPPFVDREVIAGALEQANALKLNDQELPELARMFGLASVPREAIEGLARRFRLALVALTRGAGGSLLWADGAWSDHPGCPAEVVDTVGAGDAFTAALVVGRLAGRPLDAINRHANEVAALVCSRPGGHAGPPRGSEASRSHLAGESPLNAGEPSQPAFAGPGEEGRASPSAALIGIAIIAALGGLLFGFDTAVVSGTTAALRTVSHLGDFGLGFTVASALVGTIVGARIHEPTSSLSLRALRTAWPWPSLLK